MIAVTAAAETLLTIEVDKPFPDMEFSSLLEPEDYPKLGLERSGGPVHLSEIPGKYLAIEFFNKSCRPCQSQVREMEAYYQSLLAGNVPPVIRVLAVAVGNKPEYLTKYREKRNMTYPIAADPEFDQWRRMGEPGRTPFIVFLRRVGQDWVLNSYHFGIHDEKELADRGSAMLEGRTARIDGPNVPPRSDRHLQMPIDEEALQARVRRLFERLVGREVPVEVLDLGEGVTLYRTRVPLTGRKLYARAATRAPVCEVCHAVHFIYVFDEDGVIVDFQPVHVTKYGNAEWNSEDVEFFTRRLRGRHLRGLDFNPQVDTVTAATMTSALIYDEMRRTQALLERLPN